MVDLKQFSDLCDLLNYFPTTIKKSSNLSPELYYILSSNTQNSAVHATPTNREGNLKVLLEEVWKKLVEKYRSLSEMFRYFDINYVRDNNGFIYLEWQSKSDRVL